MHNVDTARWLSAGPSICYTGLVESLYTRHIDERQRIAPIDTTIVDVVQHEHRSAPTSTTIINVVGAIHVSPAMDSM